MYQGRNIALNSKKGYCFNSKLIHGLFTIALISSVDHDIGSRLYSDDRYQFRADYMAIFEKLCTNLYTSVIFPNPSWFLCFQWISWFFLGNVLNVTLLSANSITNLHYNSRQLFTVWLFFSSPNVTGGDNIQETMLIIHMQNLCNFFVHEISETIPLWLNEWASHLRQFKRR